MATEKIGIYRRWRGKLPKVNGKPAPKSKWPKCREYSWTVRWYGNTGKRYSKSFRTKKLAEQFARKLQEEVNRGKADRPDKITLSAFSKEHKEVMVGQIAYASLYDQMRALRLFEKFIGGSRLMSSIKPRDAEAFISIRLKSGLAVATVNKDIRTLRRIFNLAIDPRGYLAEGQNPFQQLRQRKKAEKRIRYVAVEEYHRLMEATQSIWWQALVSIAYGSGLRRNEILNLTWRDIDFENQRVHVTPKEPTESTIEWEPKDHEKRVVPMSDETTRLLVDIQTASAEGFPYIFISPQRFEHIKERIRANRWNGNSEIVNNIWKNFEVLRKKTRVLKCSLHDLRRSAITNWAQSLPIQVVQQLAGHSDINTTRKYYLAVRPDDMTAANKTINSILASERTH
jgi:integrase